MEGAVDGEFADSPGPLRSHLSEDADRCAGEIEFISFREDSHDRHHSGAEATGEEVGRGKSFCSSVVVDRRIGFDCRAERSLLSRASQFSFVLGIDFNHGT